MKAYVTYSIVTPESAEHGEYDEYGDIGEYDSLHDAIAELFTTRTNMVDGIRATSGHYADYGKRMCLSVFNGMEYETGAEEQRSIHIHGISRASAFRISKLLNIKLDNF
jgi:hypothetical protein